MGNIVIVDEHDDLIGEEERDKCHEGDGILHRGFLVMVYNNRGELLLTRRSEQKRLWPGFWDGTVASHVLRGESYVEASKRRLVEEIGLAEDKVDYLFKFRYHVRYGNIGSENEICAVTRVDMADTNGTLINNREISDVRFVAPQALLRELSRDRDSYTPWLLLTVEELKKKGLW